MDRELVTTDGVFVPSGPAHASEYLALALMYFAQGLPSGLAFNALGALIRQGGHPVAEVGLTGLAFLPWALKFLWAGPIDNACARWGHARLIGVTQTLAVLLYLGLAPFPPGTYLVATLIGVIALNSVCATQDIVTNAYAVSRLQGRAAGPANAIQVAAFIAGMLAGGGGLLVLHAHVGWADTMLLMALLLVLLYLPLGFGRRWRDGTAPRPATQRVRLRDLRRHADLGWALAIALLFKFAGTAISTLVQPWLVDRGLSLAQVGTLQMSNLIANAVGGVLIGVPLVRWLGDRRAALAGCVIVAMLLGTAWGLQVNGLHDARIIYVAFGVQALGEGAMYVAVWALFMNWASPQRPGTDFTAMQCCESLANGLAAGVIGGLSQRVGYGHAFALAWLAGGIAVALIAWCLPRLNLLRESRA
ncbi:MAG: MFS transporter [Achromobacter sp.]|uniref:MFS transporter n=1 Tax=Achromobacter sp. TaxID=134375 RepID=UPI003CFC9940